MHRVSTGMYWLATFFIMTTSASLAGVADLPHFQKNAPYTSVSAGLRARGWHEVLTTTAGVFVWKRRNIVIAVEVEPVNSIGGEQGYIFEKIRCRRGCE